MRTLVGLLGLSLLLPGKAQYWSDAGIVIDAVGEIGRFYVDTADNKLYSTGIWVSGMGQPDQALRYPVLDGSEWSLSPPLGGMALTFANYHDTLYMGGEFNAIGGEFISHAARRVNGVWESCGIFNNSVRRFEVIDDELYVIGYFTTINGSPCQGVAKWVGNGWECVAELNASSCLPVDITKYQGRLVLSGTITFDGNPYRHIVQYVDGVWIPVGPEGIYGGLSGGGQLQVYQDELYVGGLIPLNAGNAGFCLQKWNGTAWSQVGAGLQDDTGGTGWNIKVKDLLVHDGKLFVCGGFGYAGHVYAPRIATWDGVEWCSVSGAIGEYEITAMAFYNDTLYIGCGLDAVLDGQPITGIAQFIAPEFSNHCSGDVSVAAINVARTARIQPLGGGRFRVEGILPNGTITFVDALGRVIAQHAYHGEEVFEVAGLASGIHLVLLPNGSTLRSASLD
ncbi:MAG: hypothetical protein JNM62_06385 [Flavobacteriales bacterium]|nr:hypothetical protein [Flavobacteriales bacterium]